MLEEPVPEAALRRLLQSAVQAGSVRFFDHALAEMDADDIDEADVLRVLRRGVDDGVDFERRRWRYRRRVPDIVVVVQLPSETLVEVVTAWRIR